MLRSSGALVGGKPIGTRRHAIGCDSVLEPRVSDQCFVRMAPLAPRLGRLRSERADPASDGSRSTSTGWRTSALEIRVSSCGAPDPGVVLAMPEDRRPRSARNLRAVPRGGPAQGRMRMCSTPGSRPGSALCPLGWPDDTPVGGAVLPGDVLSPDRTSFLLGVREYHVRAHFGRTSAVPPPCSCTASFAHTASEDVRSLARDRSLDVVRVVRATAPLIPRSRHGTRTDLISIRRSGALPSAPGRTSSKL